MLFKYCGILQCHICPICNNTQQCQASITQAALAFPDKADCCSAWTVDSARLHRPRRSTNPRPLHTHYCMHAAHRYTLLITLSDPSKGNACVPHGIGSRECCYAAHKHLTQPLLHFYHCTAAPAAAAVNTSARCAAGQDSAACSPAQLPGRTAAKPWRRAARTAATAPAWTGCRTQGSLHQASPAAAAAPAAP